MAVENEEDFSDQLKEYYGYCDSLKHICKKQEVMELELEQAEDQLDAKKTERDNFSQGKTGLFGELYECLLLAILSLCMFMILVKLLM